MGIICEPWCIHSDNHESDKQVWEGCEFETCDTKAGDVLDPRFVSESRREEVIHAEDRLV
jgi:hypothetical protein